MATENVTAGAGPTTFAPIDIDAPPPDGLKVERYGWGAIYTGTRQALIAAGFAGDGMFPGDPGRGKTAVTYKQEGDSASRSIQRRGRTQYVYWVKLSATELQQRQAAHDAAQARRDALAKAAAETRRRMGRMKHSAADFRADAVQAGEWFLPVIMKTMQGETGTALGGYRFDEEARRQVAHHIESINRLIRDGRVMFDPALRDHHMKWCAQPLREADPDFTAAVGRLCDAGPLAEPE